MRKERLRKWIESHKFTRELFGNYSFRTVAFAVISFIINIGYALFNAVIGVIGLSVWYGAF